MDFLVLWVGLAVGTVFGWMLRVWFAAPSEVDR